MEISKKNLTTAKGAKDYLSKNEIPQLFECLMTGLMYNRPEDYIDYLQECLEKIKKQGISAVRWDMFLEAKKTPLPPIESLPREDFRPEPLPEIGSYQLKLPIEADIIILQSGPGMNKADISQQLVDKYGDFARVHVGALTRDRAKLEESDPNSKWQNVAKTIHNGELAPSEFVIETLIKELNGNPNHKHYIIEGYPRSLQEREDFERFITVARLRFVLMLDSEEETCLRRLRDRVSTDGWMDQSPASIHTRLTTYKTSTLPVCKFFDDIGKLHLINAEENQVNYFNSIQRIIEKEIYGRDTTTPLTQELKTDSRCGNRSTASSTAVKPVTEIQELTEVPKETERDVNVFQGRLVLLLGGPGSGKSEVARTLCEKNPAVVHLDMNTILRENVMSSDAHESDLAELGVDATEETLYAEAWNWKTDGVLQTLKALQTDENSIILLEGYPRNKEELCDINIEVGGVSLVFLLDSEEETMRHRLEDRFTRLEQPEDYGTIIDLRLESFKNNGLSICRYYDERSRLNIINSEQDVLYTVQEISKILFATAEAKGEDEVNETAEAKGEDEVNETVQDESEDADEEQTHEVEVREIEMEEANFESRVADDIDILKTDPDEEVDPETENKSQEDANEEEIEDNEEKEDEETAFEEEENIEDNLSNGEDLKEDVVETENIEIDDSENKRPVDIEDENLDDEDKNKDVENTDEDEMIEPVTATVLGDKGVRTESQMKIRDATVILLLGGPGSGKKTIGSHLVSKYACSFIHLEQLIHKEIQSESEEADSLKQFLEHPEEDHTAVVKLLRRSLANAMEVSPHIVVAGYPTTINQMNSLAFDLTDPTAIFHLDASANTLKSRLTTEEEEADSEEIPENRVDQFQTRFETLLGEITSSEKYHKIEAEGEVDQVVTQIATIIDDLALFKTD